MPVEEYRSKQVVQALQIEPNNEAEIVAFIEGQGDVLKSGGQVTSVELWTQSGPLSYNVYDWIVRFGDYNFDGIADAEFAGRYESISAAE